MVFIKIIIPFRLWKKEGVWIKIFFYLVEPHESNVKKCLLKLGAVSPYNPDLLFFLMKKVNRSYRGQSPLIDNFILIRI
jgi:hypothetical protein